MSIGELKCPSLDYVYDMTWAEFRIRMAAWNREQERLIMATRELAWITYIAPHQNPKKMKKSINAFWPIKKKKKKVADEDLMRRRIKDAQDSFFKEQNQLEND